MNRYLKLSTGTIALAAGAVTGDWDHYRVDYVDRSDDIQLWSVGVLYKF
jgi:hypothetical protein